MFDASFGNSATFSWQVVITREAIHGANIIATVEGIIYTTDQNRMKMNQNKQLLLRISLKILLFLLYSQI